MQKLLKTYQKRLTNLSSRNRSLVLMRTSKNYFFDLTSLDFRLNIPSYDLLSAVFSGKKPVKICTHQDPRDEKSNLLSKELLSLFRSDQLIQAERGAMDLKLGFPFVQGRLMNESVLRCPLLFLPVKLFKDDKHWQLERTGDLRFNSSFLLAYQQFNNVKLSEEFLEEDFQDFSKDLSLFILELYNYLNESSLTVNFNSELFEKKLRFFENFKKEDLELLPQGELKLHPQAILGIFPEAGSYISQDYQQLIAADEGLALDTLFATELCPKPKEKDLHLPLMVDASQEKVISEIARGASMLVQGPPGSGKSQLIANVMADFAAKGKKVLLVCQKRAAIDMVYKRLSEVGISSYAALVHDFKSDRKELYAQIAGQIDGIEQNRKENHELDAIFLEREFNQISNQIEQLSSELEDFKRALYDESKFGKSPKELYLLASQFQASNKTLIDLSQQVDEFDYSRLTSLVEVVKKLEKYQHSLVEIGDSFWVKRKDSRLWNTSTLSTLIDSVFNKKDELLRFEFLKKAKREKIFSLCNLIASSNISVASFFVPPQADEIASLQTQLDIFRIKEKTFAAFDKTDTVRLLEAAEHAHQLSKSTLKFAWYKLTNKTWKQIQPWLFNSSLKGLISDLLEYNKLNSFKAKYNFGNIEEGYIALEKQKLIYQVCADLRVLGIENAKNYDQIYELKEFYNKTLLELNNFLYISELVEVFEFSEMELKAYLKAKLDLMQGSDELLVSLSKVEMVVYKLCERPEILEASMIHHFIERLETQNPILKGVSSLKISEMETDLQFLIKKKQELSQANLLIQLKENTYRHIDKNRLGNTTTYRELRHQCVKKKRIWPVRKVLESFDEELFNLIPCWMASPETVSAIFPMQRLFDLVIFDEASQCYAEQGLPAMLRGKQLLVAGDSMQLQPSDLYSIRYEEDTADDYVLEIESFLNLTKEFLPDMMLTGHYRSKSLPLIGFSNRHFYQNKLQLIPHFDTVNSDERSIEYHKVNGVWDQQQNQIEAEMVNVLVKKIDATSPEKTIGIVTFNHRQAELIREMLITPNVSVKNIENIQGDEFDILIFSIAYAPDTSGKLRFQFGTLGQAGGENRLNVAITRAKEKVIIVSSILPEDLKIENASNLGPKLLKSYLAYAISVSDGSLYKEEESQNSQFGLSLAQLLSKENANLNRELPFADLSKKVNDTYESLILTDDNLFYQTISAKEAFAYIPISLAQKSWKISRSWSRNYWKQN